MGEGEIPSPISGEVKYMATYTKGKSVQISKNFESTEFDCNCKKYCKSTEIDPKLAEYLQKIRDHFGQPVTINSAYRCSKYNKSIGGASKSKHLYGQAADIKVSGVTPLKVAQYAESIGIKGIGQYSNFVHIDTRTIKYFWYGNEQESRSTFGKYVDTTENQTASSPVVETPSASTTIVSGAKTIKVTGDTVNIRKGPGTKFAKLQAPAKKGDTFQTPDTKGWVPIIVDNAVYWISEKYVK